MSATSGGIVCCVCGTKAPTAGAQVSTWQTIKNSKVGENDLLLVVKNPQSQSICRDCITKNEAEIKKMKKEKKKEEKLRKKEEKRAKKDKEKQAKKELKEKKELEKRQKKLGSVPTSTSLSASKDSSSTLQQEHDPFIGQEYKLLMLGDSEVGKTCLCIRLIQNVFVNKYDPTIEDTYRKRVLIDSKTALIEVVDTAGKDVYASIRDQYIRKGEGFIIVYSIANRESFEKVPHYRDLILSLKDKQPVPITVVGNKNDLEEREVEHEEGVQMASKLGCAFIETSAQISDRTPILELYYGLVRDIRMIQEAERRPGKKS